MKTNASPGKKFKFLAMVSGASRPAVVYSFLVISLFLSAQTLFAQKSKSTPPRKLPSVDKITDNYLKAIGGKKLVAAIKDANYEWVVQLKDQPFGTARTQRKPPSSERLEMTFGNGQIISATSASSAWEMGLDGQMRTLIGAEGAAAKLRALLDASHLVNYKKSNVLARVISLDDPGTEASYIVEYATRSGARLRYHFSTKTSLLIKITDEFRKTQTWFEDYRPERGILEPHRIRISAGNTGELTLLLQSVKYDGGLADRIFDPPAATEALDVPALLRAVGKNQDEIEKRVTEYGDKIRYFFEEHAFLPDGTLKQARERSINKIGHALHDLDLVFDRFSRSPQIRQVVADLGIEQPLLLQSMYIFKQPNIGGEVTCHQDSTFLYTEPIDIAGFWFALEDATIDNGCLWIIPGGHQQGLKSRWVRTSQGGMQFRVFDSTPWSDEKLQPLQVRKGTLILLHGLLPHRSLENKSPKSRPAYTLHVIGGHCVFPQDNWLRRSPSMPLRGSNKQRKALETAK